MGRLLSHILKLLYCMIKKGASKHSLLTDLHHVSRCGKIARKAISDLLTAHHDNSGEGFASAFSCRSMDPDLAFYNPRAVEFSCSNTPAANHTKRKHRHRGRPGSYDTNPRALFEVLNKDAQTEEECCSVEASPSPGMGDGEVGSVDMEAEEFIRLFYEDLRLQQLVEARGGRRM